MNVRFHAYQKTKIDKASLFEQTCGANRSAFKSFFRSEKAEQRSTFLPLLFPIHIFLLDNLNFLLFHFQFFHQDIEATNNNFHLQTERSFQTCL